jgi:hypothetical protein
MPIEVLSVRVPKYTYNEKGRVLEVSGPPFEMGTRVNLGERKMIMHKKRLVAVIPVVKANGEETGLLVRENEKDSLYNQKPQRTSSKGRHFTPANF